MTKREFQISKDISCAFAEWIDQNTYHDLPHRRLSENDDAMDYDELFYYYIHNVLTEIEMEKIISPK